MRSTAALLTACLVAAPAAADTVAPAQAGEQAAAAASALQSAIEDLRKAQGARNRVAALTRTIQAYESGLGALRDGLRRVAIREAALTALLAAKRDRIGALLGVLASVQRTPAPLLLMHPEGPLGAVRAAMIAQDVTPGLQAEALQLRAQLQELAALHKVQDRSAGILRAGLAAVQAARTDLSEAVSNRADLPKRLTASAAQLGRVADSVKTLNDFAKVLSDQKIGPGPAEPPFADAKGQLPMPVDGTILRHAGEADAAGIKRPGIVIATRPRALVTAPWSATIRYLGPLLDYGNVIVLEPGDGYLLVLAGLDEVYGKVGQVISAGDPVGLMGGREADPGAAGAGGKEGGGAERPETLYMELRKGDTPVDPEAWLAPSRREERHRTKP
ncbi:murein hydrolase activator EnvC family protein [Acidimangrovimonas sediminis]|uniref:murein hydrolase activator EnvC family protein n=1 Tax=Acidimangrovimonas sediminis TaxID=2056283 RepID=UPI000C80CC1A|nr:peptidoglycan DD-metalloendopeptidase family protein [Acidimangrovimonas sediminis]